MSEQWRPLLGEFGKYYQVSDAGRVRAMPRPQWRNTVSGRVLIARPDATWIPRILRPKTKKAGYQEVCLKRGKIQRMAYVHRLVLEAFVGKPSSSQRQAAHLNGIRDDNHLSNLVWATPGENTKHKEFHGTKHGVIEKRWAAFLLLDNGMSLESAAKCLSLSPDGVREYARLHLVHGQPSVSSAVQ